MKGGSVGGLAAVVLMSGAVLSCRGEEALWSLWTSLVISLPSELKLGCTLEWLFGRSVGTCATQKGNILRLRVTSRQRNATSMSAPYRGGLGGVPALALLLQTSNQLILGAHDGREGSVFLLQLPVVAGHLQGLSRDVLDRDAATSAVFQQGKWKLCSPVLWHWGGGSPPASAPEPGLSCEWLHAAAARRAGQCESSCCCCLSAELSPPWRATPPAPAGPWSSPAVPAAARAPSAAQKPPSGWWSRPTACSHTARPSASAAGRWRCRSSGPPSCLKAGKNVSECCRRGSSPSALQPLVRPSRVWTEESSPESASSPSICVRPPWQDRWKKEKFLISVHVGTKLLLNKSWISIFSTEHSINSWFDV